MDAPVLAAILQVFLVGTVVANRSRKLQAGSYIPMGIAAMGLTFAAITLMHP